MTFIPYLVFAGKAAEAMRFYENTFGGTITMEQRFSEVRDSTIPESMKNLIVHGRVKIGDTELYFSDSPKPVWKGNNITLSVQFETEEELNRVYKALESGGKVAMPLQKTFWNAIYANVEDRFGINWQLNYQLPQPVKKEEKTAEAAEQET